MRIEPAPSEPSAAGTMPAATAAAEPPLEPPGVCSGFQGLRVIPYVLDSVNGHSRSSGALVRPTRTAPASRRRRTTSESALGRAVLGRGAEGGHVALDVGVVLDRHRNPQQRQLLARAQALVGGPGGGTGGLGVHLAEGIQAPVQRGDALQGGVDQLARGQLALAQRPRLCHQPGEGELVTVHARQTIRGSRRSPARASSGGRRRLVWRFHRRVLTLLASPVAHVSRERVRQVVDVEAFPTPSRRPADVG